MMKDFWNERYSEEGFAYGIDPNDFLVQSSSFLRPHSKLLCIAEGEGRNAIYLAKLGFDVTSVDQSIVGINKTIHRAKEENINLHAILSDLEEFDFGENRWDGVISIFGHLPTALRIKVHDKIIKGLKKEGIFLFEAYTVNQLKFGTGGPKDPDMFLSKEIVKNELHALEVIKLEEKERMIKEGKYHNGMSDVIQFIGKK